MRSLLLLPLVALTGCVCDPMMATYHDYEVPLNTVPRPAPPAAPPRPTAPETKEPPRIVPGSIRITEPDGTPAKGPFVAPLPVAPERVS